MWIIQIQKYRFDCLLLLDTCAIVLLLTLQKLDMVSKKDEYRTVNNTYYIICHCNNNNNNDYKKGNKKLWESGGKGQFYVKLKS